MVSRFQHKNEINKRILSERSTFGEIPSEGVKKETHLQFCINSVKSIFSVIKPLTWPQWAYDKINNKVMQSTDENTMYVPWRLIIFLLMLNEMIEMSGGGDVGDNNI